MDKIIYGLFLFSLIFSPLAFGAVEQWSLTVMEASSLLALTLLLYKRTKLKSGLFEIPGIVPLFLFLSYMAFQLFPIPPEIIKLVSPETYSIYDKTVWVEGQRSWTPLSISKKATVAEIIRITSYAAFYILTVQLLADKVLLKKTVFVLILFASVLSFFGILQHILSNNKIFWLRELTQGGYPFGPYVNRNHYAGLVGMIFPLVLSVFVYFKPVFSYGSLRERTYEFFSQTMSNMHIILGFSAVLIALSIFLSMSRGGIISLSLSIMLLSIMLVRSSGKSSRGILVLATIVLVLYSVGWFGWDPIFERFSTIRNPQGDIAELRVAIWRDTIAIAKDFPLTGTGFGSFINIYPGYRTIQTDGIADHAHNDYLELLSDGGIVAVILFGWFISSVLYKSYTVFLKRKEGYSQHIFMGSLAGILSMLFHSITDFNMHIGANALYFFFLAGLAVSSAHTRLHAEEKTYLQNMQLALPKGMLVLSSAFLVFSFIFNVSVLAGQRYASSLKSNNPADDATDDNLRARKTALIRASWLDPLEAGYQFGIATTDRMLGNKESSLMHYRNAVTLNPVSGQHLQMLGLVMSEMKKDDQAAILLQTGVSADVMNPSRYQVHALWLFSHGRKEQGIRQMREAISLEPQKTAVHITTMVLNGLNDEEIRRALPDKSEAMLIYADYLLLTGREMTAAKAYLDALEYTEKESNISPLVFSRIYHYFREKSDYDKALMVMKKASEKFPHDIGTRLTTAAAFEEAGIFYKAAEEYRNILVLDPSNNTAKKKLQEIKQ